MRRLVFDNYQKCPLPFKENFRFINLIKYSVILCHQLRPVRMVLVVFNAMMEMDATIWVKSATFLMNVMINQMNWAVVSNVLIIKTVLNSL